MTTTNQDRWSGTVESASVPKRMHILRFILSVAVCALFILSAASDAFAQRTRRLKGDAERGAELFRVCAPCHDVGPRARHKTGPGFNRIIGKLIGTYDGYRSSVAMTYFGTLGEKWTRDLLDLYLQDPERFTVGQLPMRRSSTSPFIGVFDPQDRADIVAYIAANGKQKKRR